MKTPHKHAELIKAWADGHEIEETYAGQGDNGAAGWHAFEGNWEKNYTVFRIKPEPAPKPDLNFYYHIDNETHLPTFPMATRYYLNLKLTFSGETGTLKSAEVIS